MEHLLNAEPRGRWIGSLLCLQEASVLWYYPEDLLWVPLRRITFQVALWVKNLPANAGDVRDVDLISGLGRPPGGGQDNPL